MGVSARLPERRPARRTCARWLLVSIAASTAASLALACNPPEVPGQQSVSLRMRGTPPDAAVIIDEEAVGQLDFVSAHGVALPPGVHHVTVKAQGYFPWDREVKAEPGDRPIQLDVALTPIPD